MIPSPRAPSSPIRSDIVQLITPSNTEGRNVEAQVVMKGRAVSDEKEIESTLLPRGGESTLSCPPLHPTQRLPGRKSSSSTPSGVHARDLSIVPAPVPPRPTTHDRGRDHISQNLMLSLLRQGLSMPFMYRRSAHFGHPTMHRPAQCERCETLGVRCANAKCQEVTWFGVSSPLQSLPLQGVQGFPTSLLTVLDPDFGGCH